MIAPQGSWPAHLYDFFDFTKGALGRIDRRHAQSNLVNLIGQLRI